MLWLNGLIRDLGYGFRMMRSARMVSIAVTLTLAVGLGINTGIFTLINGMLLRARTDSDPATFARLYAQYWSGMSRPPVSYWKSHAISFRSMA